VPPVIGADTVVDPVIVLPTAPPFATAEFWKPIPPLPPQPFVLLPGEPGYPASDKLYPPPPPLPPAEAGGLETSNTLIKIANAEKYKKIIPNRCRSNVITSTPVLSVKFLT
jgi:hypothetical protein